MKKRSLPLVAYVFIQTQSWGAGRRSQFPGKNVSLIGTYAGVLIPDTVQTGTSLSGAPLAPSITSIGLFSLGVPETGLGAGATSFLSMATPTAARSRGWPIRARARFGESCRRSATSSLFDPNNPTINFRIFASGNIQATIFSLATAATGATPGSTRFEGTAAINVSGGGPGYDGAFTYIVDGFKQSDTVTTTTTIPGVTTGN